MAKIRKVVERELSTGDFAKIAKVTVKTVQGYCRKIYANNLEVLDTLNSLYGLISIKRLPDNTWSLRVKTLQ